MNISDIASEALSLTSCTHNCRIISFGNKEEFQSKHSPVCMTKAGIVGEKFSAGKGIFDTLYVAGCNKIKATQFHISRKAKPVCDCGAKICKTTHAHWCSTKKNCV